MSIADQMKIRELEERVASLEAQVQELLALVTEPKKEKRTSAKVN